jgi:tetratricopeptide (TPR) repeat protein
MIIKNQKRIFGFLWTCFAFFILLAPLKAETRDEQLNALFSELHEASSAEVAARVEGRIQALWARSSSPTTDLLMERAAMAMAKQDFPVAIELLDRVIAREPDFAEGWNRRATVFFLMDDYNRSISDIAETLKREPRHFGALSGLGFILLMRGDLVHARETYEKVLTIYPMMESARLAIKKIDEEKGETAL